MHVRPTYVHIKSISPILHGWKDGRIDGWMDGWMAQKSAVLTAEPDVLRNLSCALSCLQTRPRGEKWV